MSYLFMAIGGFSWLAVYLVIALLVFGALSNSINNRSKK